MGNALSSSSVELLSNMDKFTAVREEGVVDGRGDDSLTARGGGIGQAKGES